MPDHYSILSPSDSSSSMPLCVAVVVPFEFRLALVSDLLLIALLFSRRRQPARKANASGSVYTALSARVACVLASVVGVRTLSGGTTGSRRRRGSPSGERRLLSCRRTRSPRTPWRLCLSAGVARVQWLADHRWAGRTRAPPHSLRRRRSLDRRCETISPPRTRPSAIPRHTQHATETGARRAVRLSVSAPAPSAVSHSFLPPPLVALFLLHRRLGPAAAVR